MYTSSKKYTKYGRYRYGSSIFVNDLKENLVDTIYGTSKDVNIIVCLFILVLSKIIGANLLGLIFVVIIMMLTYFATEKNSEISFTDKRIFQLEYYRHPRFVKIFGNTLIIAAIVVAIRTLLINNYWDTTFGLFGIESILAWFGFSNILIYQYRVFFKNHHEILTNIDLSISIIIYLWFGLQYYYIRYKFHEVNYEQISEILINKGKTTRLSDILLFAGLFYILHLIFADILSFIVLGIIIFLYRYHPRSEVSFLSIRGSSDRKVFATVEISPKEYTKVTRAIASVFKWIPQGDYTDRDFPQNIVPKEVASIYKTGLRASFLPALKYANNIGAIVSSIINLIVVIILFRYAFLFIPSQIDYVIYITVGLIFLSIGFYIFIIILNNIRYMFQLEETLMIGQSFIARYLEPTLWILKSEKMEGTKVERGARRPLFQYDKVRGFVVGWRRLFVLGIVLTITSILLIWQYLGALNISLLVYILPFIFDLGIQFLEEKASAELSFFIISGYVLWGIIILVFPRFFINTRPTLYLELEYTSTMPIILRDFEDHQDASLQFTKSLIHTSRPPRRKTPGRPGLFNIQVILKSIEGTTSYDKIYFEFGPHNIKSKILSVEDSMEQELVNNLRLSGIKGFPEMELNIHAFDDQDKSTRIYSDTINLIINKKMELEIMTENDLIIKLLCIKQKQKS